MAGTRTVWGYVNGKTDKPYSGTGYQVIRKGTGWKAIVLDDPFPVKPAINVTQVYSNEGKPGSPLDNATAVSIDTHVVEIVTGEDNGKWADRDFAFMIVGPE